eukprot:c23847_g1_i1 orf=488-1210(+)
MPWWQRESIEQRQLGAGIQQQHQNGVHHQNGVVEVKKSSSMSAVAKVFLATKRRLRVDPNRKLHFLYEPGKQVSSALTLKNTSRSPVAFKFQTNAPKSCFMRPPSGIIPPGDTTIITIVKFVEQPEHDQEKKSKDKFKVVSLKVKQGTEFSPELFDEQKEFVVVERVLRVVFLDPQSQSSEIEKLKKRLAEAEAAQQAQKKLPEERSQVPSTAGGVLEDWKEQQKEKRLAKQQVEGGDSL